MPVCSFSRVVHTALPRRTASPPSVATRRSMTCFPVLTLLAAVVALSPLARPTVSRWQTAPAAPMVLTLRSVVVPATSTAAPVSVEPLMLSSALLKRPKRPIVVAVVKKRSSPLSAATFSVQMPLSFAFPRPLARA
ncbi:hypothetical protein M438DRAFT_78259 [Aureobasidium pullulans EXF-150]|uniref:Uncharacterized protein n=1 Tax=Aureobasidium pullulans EXF-150 TaxID=1043002 RepID=A0A074X715_AURPU|nr:uncharacterized protein M438DRAFT_78259 [Aureobasidium pullulans EXF-150]KEQ81310.1 hypothetical protein M438DRAFT_78259 [Aureobasidium pullulans EXF-150]